MGSPYKTVAFQTLGCKLNFAETSTLARFFIQNGYARVDYNSLADVYVINSCSVTKNADKKTRKAVRQALRRSPFSKIAVVGCYAQLKAEEIAKIPGVNIVVGTEEKFNIPFHLESDNNDGKSTVLTSEINSVHTFNSSFSEGERTRSFLKVQDGCDFGCSFCTIPLARGQSRSGSLSDIIYQANQIAQTNIREIVLTGVNIGDFGVSRDESFYDLIKALDKVDGIERYRISSIEPNLLTDEIIDFTADSKKFLPHFHIPLQSGSDQILKAMRRRYKTKLYADRVQKIKSILPDACIGVDVIAGFPGESDDNFQETFDFLHNLDISYLHVFSYSQRDNTDAIRIDPKVPKNIISERSKILHCLGMEKKCYFYENNIGEIKQVLIENWEAGILSGHSDNYIPVKIFGESSEVNQIIPVKLIRLEDGKMQGDRLN